MDLILLKESTALIEALARVAALTQHRHHGGWKIQMWQMLIVSPRRKRRKQERTIHGGSIIIRWLFIKRCNWADNANEWIFVQNNMIFFPDKELIYSVFPWVSESNWKGMPSPTQSYIHLFSWRMGALSLLTKRSQVVSLHLASFLSWSHSCVNKTILRESKWLEICICLIIYTYLTRHALYATCRWNYTVMNKIHFKKLSCIGCKLVHINVKLPACKWVVQCETDNQCISLFFFWKHTEEVNCCVF